VAGDREEPGTELLVPAEAAHEPERAEEGLLRDVFGERPVAREMPREPEDVGLERADELLEGRQLTAPRAVYGSRIGVPHRVPLTSFGHRSLGRPARRRERSKRPQPPLGATKLLHAYRPRTAAGRSASEAADGAVDGDLRAERLGDRPEVFEDRLGDVVAGKTR